MTFMSKERFEEIRAKAAALKLADKKSIIEDRDVLATFSSVEELIEVSLKENPITKNI